MGTIPDDETPDNYAHVRDHRMRGAWGRDLDPPTRSMKPTRAALLQEMFCEIQDRFGAMDDEALWAMTPRNFYGKLEQAKRFRQRFIADLATAMMYGGADKAQEHIANLYKAIE